MTIQEVCKAKRNALGMTIQDIAEASGIPPSTVNNFFTHASKAPYISTVGPICAVLGVSLDEFYGIGDHLTASEETLQAEKDGLEHRIRQTGCSNRGSAPCRPEWEKAGAGTPDSCSAPPEMRPASSPDSRSGDPAACSGSGSPKWRGCCCWRCR